jgi:hypothetical protein
LVSTIRCAPARASKQFNFQRPPTGPWTGNYDAKIAATVQFDGRYEFTLRPRWALDYIASLDSTATLVAMSRRCT